MRSACGSTRSSQATNQLTANSRTLEPEVRKETVTPLFILTFLIFWVFSALAAYSYAGERMPWLTVHIAWPMILLAGYAFGLWIEKIDWSLLLSKWGWLVITMLILLVVSSARLVAAFLDPIPPFSGNQLGSTILHDRLCLCRAILPLSAAPDYSIFSNAGQNSNMVIYLAPLFWPGWPF